MSQAYDLTQLDSHTFEHLVNFLSLKVLGNGVTGFATGPDGGRDGYLKGKALYPSELENWDGVWFLQSKFHKPHLSKDPQKWLIGEVKKEIDKLQQNPRRERPNNWIIATNIEPSGQSKTGSFDKIVKLVHEFDQDINVDVWGGRKILDFLLSHPEAALTYGHFLTPGHVISKLYSDLKSREKNIETIINHIIVNQFIELSYTKLEQAGAGGDQRPKIFQLFRDLPITTRNYDEIHYIMDCLVSSSSNVQKNSMWSNYGDLWRDWSKNPKRARVLLLKGGPGQGKSTAGQYFGQIQRAAYLLEGNKSEIPPQCLDFAKELKEKASEFGFWPNLPRIPIFIELKDYANWYGTKGTYEPKNIVAYLCEKIRQKTAMHITAEMLHSAFQLSCWFANFDGLDEVPNDLKDEVANEIITFTNELIPHLDADFLVLCTTRPQGYSGQFENLHASEITLIPLPDYIALECASAVVRFNRENDEAEASLAILKSAMASEQVKELMTTPLQAHIMAVVVRDGGRPPEKRWALFNNFYNVMKKRESLKNFPDQKIQTLLREQDQLLKSIHDRLGMCLHAKAENSKGAEATLDRGEFKKLALQTVEMQFEENKEEIVSTLMEATTERLVFVNTPDNSESVRFDIRQLQEFFSAEFVYTAVSNEEFRSRLEVICGDAHWREVVHFLLSALVYHQKMSELVVAVDIIKSLDNDDENNGKRTFLKYMGTGALLTLRLLNEGVLEQDKKIRNPFASSLLPIWGMIDKDALQSILAVKKEQSKKWVTSTLINTMMEMDYSEHIVSGYLSSLMITSDNPQLPDIIERIKNAPEYYLRASIVLSQDDSANPRRNKIFANDWFVQLIINFLFSAKYNGNQAQYLAASYLMSTKDNVIKKLSHFEMDSDERFLLQIMLMDFDEDNNDPHPSHVVDEGVENDYCFIKPYPNKNNWFQSTNDNLIPLYTFTNSQSSTLASLLMFALKFHYEPCVHNFRNLIKSIIENNFDCDIIPEALKALLPIDFRHHDFQLYIQTKLVLSDNDIKDILSTKNTTLPKRLINVDTFKFDNREFDKFKWAKLCVDFPQIALKLWARVSFNNDNIDYAKKNCIRDFYTPLADIALNHPNLISPYFSLWNEIFISLPEKEKELRCILLNIDKHRTDNFYGLNIKHTPFKLNLPSENKFIINLAYSLFSDSYLGTMLWDNRISLFVSNYNESYLSQLGLSDDYLIELVKDDTNCDLLRVACLSCLITLIRENKNEMVDGFFSEGFDNLIINLISDETIDLIVRSIYIFFNEAKYLDDRLECFLGRFSHATRGRFYVRMLMQNIYQDLRERSSSPVEQNDALSKWMEYEF